MSRNKIIQEQQPDGSEILEDIIVNLYRAQGKVAEKHDLRLIKIRNKAGDEIWFLTNLFEMLAYASNTSIQAKIGHRSIL